MPIAGLADGLKVTWIVYGKFRCIRLYQIREFRGLLEHVQKGDRWIWQLRSLIDYLRFDIPTSNPSFHRHWGEEDSQAFYIIGEIDGACQKLLNGAGCGLRYLVVEKFNSINPQYVFRHPLKRDSISSLENISEMLRRHYMTLLSSLCVLHSMLRFRP